MPKPIRVDFSSEEMDICTKEAALRREAYKHNPLENNMSENNQLYGIMGEWSFGRVVGIRPKFVYYGDGGKDFIIDCDTSCGRVERFIVDIKAARIPKYLPGRFNQRAHIYVLVGIICDFNEYPTGVTYVHGWEWGRKLWKMPMRDLGDGVPVHCKERELLRDMEELKERIVGSPQETYT